MAMANEMDTTESDSDFVAANNPGDASTASSQHRSAGSIGPTLAAVVASGAYVLPWVISRSTTPSPDHPRIFLWYRLLRQPRFKPPDIAVPLTWFGVESGLAYAAYRLLRRPGSTSRTRALTLLFGNIVGIGAWSRLFFGGRNLPASTVAASALIVSSATYVGAARKIDKPAAAAGVPMVAWVVFATVLTAAIWKRNR